MKMFYGADRITDGNNEDLHERSAELRRILKWLWNAAVRPVLQDLRYLSSSALGTKLPRIWWMTNGLLGMASLHAAGSNWYRSRGNIAAHVVSSYTPIIKALKYAGEKSLQSLPWPEQKFLAVVTPDTPSFGDLNALPEVSVIGENVARSGIPRHEGRHAARPHR
jgi:hypothetical protein